MDRKKAKQFRQCHLVMYQAQSFHFQREESPNPHSAVTVIFINVEHNEHQRKTLFLSVSGYLAPSSGWLHG